MEQLLKVDEVQAAWAAYRSAEGISAKACAYETEYAIFLRKSYPGRFLNFNTYDMAKVLWRALCRLNIQVPFEQYMNNYVEFLDPELNHDRVVLVMNAVVSKVVRTFEDYMDKTVLQTLLLALFKFCVGA
jgi:hypothetical protein